MRVKCKDCDIEFDFNKKDIKINKEIRRKHWDNAAIEPRIIMGKKAGLFSSGTPNQRESMVNSEYWNSEIKVVFCPICGSEIELNVRFITYAYEQKKIFGWDNDWSEYFSR